jgi:hypothetical protein
MTDLGSFRVQTDLLREHAPFWADRATDASGARDLIETGVGQGYKFGLLAGSCGVSSRYDTWSQAMSQALTDAHDTFHWLEAALKSTADAYDGADNTSAMGYDDLDRMIEP